MLLISTICLGLSFLFIIKYIDKLEYNACDIIEINDQYKNIIEDSKSLSIPELEKKHHCRIIMRSQLDYTNQLYQAIKRSDIILDYMEENQLLGNIIFTDHLNSFEMMKQNITIALIGALLLLLLTIYIITYFLYHRIVLPFRRLERFADNISIGELEMPLSMDRANYFGAFTESFDMMREELKRARQGEYQANISKKELVAQLSHDIKTPVSTIKALCELLEVKVKEDDTVMKIRTIHQKADVIDKLISNMIHATRGELMAHQIEPRGELSAVLGDMFHDLNRYGKIYIKNELPGCLIYCDCLRLNQVIDNIINNSYKYANTDIEVTYHEGNHSIEVEIRDFGANFTAKELPLVFEKYYRGENASNQSGSGLGLYLAKIFMKGMDGEIECRLDQGFVVKLTIKKV